MWLESANGYLRMTDTWCQAKDPTQKEMLRGWVNEAGISTTRETYEDPRNLELELHMNFVCGTHVQVLSTLSIMFILGRWL